MSCPHLVINPKNQLVVLNCFEERQILKNLGAKWDGASRAWVLAFTMTNLEQVLDAIPHMTIAPDVEAKAIEQEKREREIVDIKRLAKVDADPSWSSPASSPRCGHSRSLESSSRSLPGAAHSSLTRRDWARPFRPSPQL
jgi:hypothetical protein